MESPSPTDSVSTPSLPKGKDVMPTFDPFKIAEQGTTDLVERCHQQGGEGRVDGAKKVEEDDAELIWLGRDPHCPPVILQPSPPRLSPVAVLKHEDVTSVPTGRSQSSWDSPTSLIYYHHDPSSTTIACSTHSDISEQTQSITSSYPATVHRARLATKRLTPLLFDLADPARTDKNPRVVAVQVSPFSPGHLAGAEEGAIHPLRSPGSVQPGSIFAHMQQTRIEAHNTTHAEAPQFPSTPYTPLLTPSTPDRHPCLTAHDSPQSTPDEGLRLFRPDSPLALGDLEGAAEIDKGTFGEKDSLQELVERTGRVAKIVRRGTD